MIASLRSRLLITYGLLITVLICLFSVGALASLLRNPLVYDNAASRLRSAQNLVNTQTDILNSLTSNPDLDQLNQAALRLNTRVIILSNDGSLIADSQAGSAAALHTQPLRMIFLSQRNEIAFLRDESNRLWLVLVQPVKNSAYLVLAVSRPHLDIIELFNNEFFRPLFLTGLIGLVLAVLLAFALAKWISSPLNHISRAVDDVTSGQYKTISVSGPNEVRSLANSFNSMVKRVDDTLQSQRDLVANVSHELKTPLTSIQGFTQAIMDGVSQTPDEISQAANVIFSEANRMNRLVQDLVTLARLEGENLELQNEQVDTATLIRGVTERFRPLIEQEGLQFSMDIPDLPSLKMHEDRLTQVISNLLDNAINYTPSGGSIGISIVLRDKSIEIRVADTGMGIPSVERERIFQRFYRANHSHPGTGLGLAITRQIVKAYGGSIHVEDNQPKGSIFVVILPCMNGKQSN